MRRVLRAVDGFLRVLKAQQIGFNFAPRKVQNPGSRGGSFRTSESGNILYGDGPALGEHAARPPFKLSPPELGQTRSGKPIPHPEDPGAHDAGKYTVARSKRFEGWTNADHADASKVHGVYEKHHNGKAGDAAHQALAEKHRHARELHAAHANIRDDVGSDRGAKASA